MPHSYIDQFSWKCLLGKQSKNIREDNGIYFWQVNSNKFHFCTNRILTESDLPNLINHSFHYLSVENTEFLKKYTIITRDKKTSTIIDLLQLTLSGGKYKKLRQSITKNQKLNLQIENNFRDISDIKNLIEEWSNILAQKYFRDNSGKNTFFYQQKFHENCLNVFIYDGPNLIAFSTASPNNPSIYIIGKALCNRYPGLSEYADYELYQLLLRNNMTSIDLGQTEGGLILYKNKWPGASSYSYYDGKVEGLK